MPRKKGATESFMSPDARRVRVPEAIVKKKAAIYVRVSTRYQVDKDSLPFQKEELVNYIKYALNIEDYVIFEDAGYSAKNTSRPKFQEMMTRIRNNEFTHLVVYKIDRISRNLLDFAQMYEELQKHRCSFVSKVEQFDTSTAMGEAMTRIVLVFAELERKMTGERVTAIMFSRAEKGLWNGAPIPIGYTWSEEKKYPVVDPEEAKIVRYIFDRYISLESALKVSNDLSVNSIRTKRGGEWTSKTVRDVIRNPFYKGTYRYNHKTQTGTEKPLSEQIIIECNHEPIISEEVWARANEIMDANAERSVAHLRGNIRYTHIFSRMMKCWYCGSTMGSGLDRPRSDGYRPSKYYCISRNRKHGCPNRHISDITLGPFILNYLANMVQAWKSTTKRTRLDSLEKALLRGKCFADVDHIEEEGLRAAYNGFVYGVARADFDPAAESRGGEGNAELELLASERDKYTRALDRLQSLYLFSDEGISEKDYILRQGELEDKLEAVNRRIAEIRGEQPEDFSDLLQKATRFYIQNELVKKRSLDFRRAVDVFDKEGLKDFFSSLIDTMTVKDGRVKAIRFKNGLTNVFVYKDEIGQEEPESGLDAVEQEPGG